MARRYGFNATITSAATKTIWSVVGSAAVRPMIADILMSSNATPADNSSLWYLLRFGTSAGTSTGVTPEKQDSGDPAAASTIGTAHTVEPTTYGTVALLDFALNQRATFRWVAAPGYEFKSPASATAGVGLQCQGIGGSGVAMHSTGLFEE